MITALLLLTSAWGAPSEEITVFGDPFARWSETRWFVSSEIMAPFAWHLFSQDGLSLPTHALSLRTVLACDVDAMLGKKGAEVLCTIEDISIAAAHASPNPGGPATKASNAVLKEVDARLTGAKLQLQVKANGAIAAIDIEGLVSRDRRSANTVEAIREILSRIAVGYHLKAKHGPEEIWSERDPQLLRLPSIVGSVGSAEIIHHSSRVDDHIVVQSKGGGVASVPIPSSALVPQGGSGASTPSGGRPSSPVSGRPSGGTSSLGGGSGGESPPNFPAPTMFDPVMPASEGGKVLDVEARFALETFGVAAYQAQSGILAERVWVVKGTSEGGVSAPHFWHAGQLVLLGDSDHPDLGQTGLVAGPGRVIDGLPAWPPLEMFQL